MTSSRLHPQAHSQAPMRGWDGGWPALHELLVGLTKVADIERMLFGGCDKYEHTNKLAKSLIYKPN